ncbi:4Fe-4S single cluster domain-containing protein [Paucibacter sp. JuS9]|uniref:4Fe-4S single cluster domain-containing protein n=1 Tax=Paucibacter sp. JuS9 TaxID=3228748 RepID=UPI003756F0E6
MTVNKEVELLISSVHFPVTVLGYGRRIGIWFQGCSIGCKGCISKDTWGFDTSKSMSIGKLIKYLVGTCGTDFDGVTISGGEPFDQADGLADFIHALRRWFCTLPSRGDKLGRDILCYSGHPLKKLQSEHAAILANLDVVISDPYIASKPQAPMRGSDNQSLVALTNLGRTRYTDENCNLDLIKSLQLVVDSQNRLWAIGIPTSGDLQRMASALRMNGIELDDISWGA